MAPFIDHLFPPYFPLRLRGSVPSALRVRLVFGGSPRLARWRLDGSRGQRLHARLEMRHRFVLRRQEEKQQDAAAEETLRAASAVAATTPRKVIGDEGFWMSVFCF